MLPANGDYCLRVDVGTYRISNEKEQQETEVYHAALPLSSAVRTGLEPATPGVTGLYSNRLNYRTKLDMSETRRSRFLLSGYRCFPIAMQSYNLFSRSPNFSATFFQKKLFFIFLAFFRRKIWKVRILSLTLHRFKQEPPPETVSVSKLPQSLFLFRGDTGRFLTKSLRGVAQSG